MLLSMRLLMMIKKYLIQSLLDVLHHLNIQAEPIHIAPTKNPRFGDLSTNLAFHLSKKIGEQPIDIANRLKTHLKLDPDLIQEISVSEPGFINFQISKNYYQGLSELILKEGKHYGRGTAGKGKTANVEFVSANPTGPLTVGHGRQAVLGDAVASILEWHGYDVTREYYYNNAGRQMRLLRQSVEARYFQELGKDIPLPEGGYKGEYIRDIVQIIRQKHGDKLHADDIIFQKKAEEHIFNNIKSSLEKIGVKHNRFTNEKTYYENKAIDELLQSLKQSDLIYESEGATWFKTSSIGKSQDRVLIKSTGEPTYRLPDMAYHQDKVNRGFDLIVDVFGADHVDTYPDVLACLDALHYDTSKIKVLIHQFVTLVEAGKTVKMSTREGQFITLENLINETGPDVVRYFFIMRGMNSHLNFDMDTAKDQSDQNPVYYLQYAHARIANIIKHGESLGYTLNTSFDPALLAHSSEVDLLKQLDLFPIVMDTALETLEPQGIANYLQSLAAHFHKFYAVCRVITDDKSLSQSRLALISAVQTVLTNGLRILGIQTPERM